MAGVMAPSPYSSAPPRMPSAMIPVRPRPPASGRCMPTRAISARMPPSPSLSARITSATYLIEVVMIRVQTISENKPSATSGVAPPAHW